MSNPIEFFATVDSVQAGDDEIRLVLAVRDSAADLTAAVQMLRLVNRLLHVAAHLGVTEDALAEFKGTIPQIKTGIQFRRDRPPAIKLDIPATDGASAMRLVGYTEQTFRFKVEDEGERTKKKEAREKAPRAPKGEFGLAWNIFHKRNLFASPDLKHVLNCDEANEEGVKARLREEFDVSSLTFVSAEAFAEWLGKKGLNNMKTTVERVNREIKIN